MKYKAKIRIKVITQNVTISDTDFSGWLAINTGTAAVQVNKITLQPTDGLDFTDIQPNVKWDSPIQVVILEEGGEVTLQQILYKEVKE